MFSKWFLERTRHATIAPTHTRTERCRCPERGARRRPPRRSPFPTRARTASSRAPSCPARKRRPLTCTAETCTDTAGEGFGRARSGVGAFVGSSAASSPNLNGHLPGRANGAPGASARRSAGTGKRVGRGSRRTSGQQALTKPCCPSRPSRTRCPRGASAHLLTHKRAWVVRSWRRAGGEGLFFFTPGYGIRSEAAHRQAQGGVTGSEGCVFFFASARGRAWGCGGRRLNTR